MPPKRRTRAAQLAPEPAPESDTEPPTSPPSLPPPPKRSDAELNLTVLRRYTPSIISILAIAPFAVLYTFSPDSQAWEKCGVEGTLFVCQLQTGRYSVVILNRKGLENFEAELRSADDVETTDEYVILQATEDGGATPVIHGLWIFEDGDGKAGGRREMVAQEIVGAAMRAQIARDAAQMGDGEVEHGDDDANGQHADVRQEQAYGLDGTTEMQAQMNEEEAVDQQVWTQQTGQTLDLLQLFGGPVKPAESPAVTREPSVAAPIEPPPVSEPRFTSNPDTDFFRAPSRSPAVQQPLATGGRQNALLDLFKK